MGTEGVLKAHPAGLGGQVDLREQGGGNAHGAVLPGHGFAELTAQLGVKGGCHTQALRPFGHIPTPCLVFCPRLGRTVPGVAGDVHRDAPGQLLGQSLESVVPLGSDSGIFQAGCQHMTDMIFCEEPLLLVGQIPFLGAALRKTLPLIGPTERTSRQGGDHLVGRIHHQPGNLLHREPGG